jgi:hypothetical protein
MDVHKETIDVAIATNRPNGKIRHYGQIMNLIDAIDKLVPKLKREATTLKLVYEAGPCGFGLYRHLTRKKHSCDVVTPLLIPKKPDDNLIQHLIVLFTSGVFCFDSGELFRNSMSSLISCVLVLSTSLISSSCCYISFKG